MTALNTPVVAFDFATWTALFPEFAACTPTQGQAWFNRAGLYFDNSPCNWALANNCTLMNFTTLMYLVTSHIAWMSAPRDANGNPAASGQPPSTLVGRISSATEGSVSVSAEWNGSGSPSEAFWLQTKYGAEFWTAISQYRTAIYSANPTVVAGGGLFPYIGARPFRRF